jgi:hypothetical protein
LDYTRTMEELSAKAVHEAFNPDANVRFLIFLASDPRRPV